MRIRYIEIDNFRGIRQLAWAPHPEVNCLIGPGDAGKTTILDAIEFALAPRYQATFDDADFYGMDPKKNTITITITIGDLPPEFRTTTGYMDHLRHWDAVNQTLIDEPDENKNYEYVLSTRLTVDKNLEPKWQLHVEREHKERSLAYTDRQKIIPTRLGTYTERHFAWGRQSVLSRLTDTTSTGKDILAEAARAARAHFAASGEDLFSAVIREVTGLARNVGVRLHEDVAAQLDVKGINVSSGGISLHHGELPLRLLGTGSARLMVAALQRKAGNNLPFALIDEVEHGLEPHRITRLLQYLKHSLTTQQVFLTTHSPIVLAELTIQDIGIVRRTVNGDTTVVPASTTIMDGQAVLRRNSSAYLAKAILVCEGKTEVGILRGLDQYWTTIEHEPMATLGTVAADGGGKDRAPQVANHFRVLSYPTALFLDNDKDPADPTILNELTAQGTMVIRWEKGKATEDVIFKELPAASLQKILGLMEEDDDFIGIPDQLRDCVAATVTSWQDLKQRCNEATVREQLAKCAKEKDWFKRRQDLCQLIGRDILGPNTKALTTSTQAAIQALRDWIDAQ